jgi:hypothetical protein
MNLNEKRVDDLALPMLQAIKANYVRGPVSRERAFEALNALAIATAFVIAGCQADGDAAMEFFLKALSQQSSIIPKES